MNGRYHRRTTNPKASVESDADVLAAIDVGSFPDGGSVSLAAIFGNSLYYSEDGDNNVTGAQAMMQVRTLHSSHGLLSAHTLYGLFVCSFVIVVLLLLFLLGCFVVNYQTRQSIIPNKTKQMKSNQTNYNSKGTKTNERKTLTNPTKIQSKATTKTY